MQQKKENSFLNVLINVLLPSVILIFLTKEQYLGQLYALLLALALPIGYGVYDYIKNRDINFFSILGLFSVFLTGGIALLKLPPEYIAYKEAGVPFVIGLAVLISQKTRFPLIKTLLSGSIDLDKIETKMKEDDHVLAFEKQMSLTTYIVAASFFLSTILNFILAKVIVVSPAGTEAFNQELGRMNLLSFPVIAFPSFIILIIAVFLLFNKMTKLTGMDIEKILEFASYDQKNEAVHKKQ